MRREAAAKGISQKTIDAALTGIQPIQKVIELDRKQPEGKWTFAQYRERIVDPVRIRRGREMMARHAAALQKIEAQYGVAPQYVVALWGIETNYGQNTGGFKIIPALATLAWEGRRAEFFKKELLNALQIIDQGHITADGMRGSWAGAMGQNQFMPSSFLAYATDGDGDGHKDIWGDVDDVFASTANYLRKSGWKAGERWGRAVRLPAGFSAGNIGLETKRPLSDWNALGVTLPDGAPLPAVPGMQASIVAPDGASGPAYLAYDNYRTIMRWNKSQYFATSVGLIADAIAD